MMLRVLFYIYLLSFFLLIVSACSEKGSPTAGGGTEIPNSIAGQLLDEENEPVQNRPVTLSKISIQKNGETRTFVKEKKSDKNGGFRFTELKPGQYRLYVKALSDKKSAAHEMLELREGTSIESQPMVLQDAITLKGRFLYPPFLRYERVIITIPGTDITTTLEADGDFILSDVPVGAVQIAFLFDEIVNILSVQLEKADIDTLDLGTLYFSALEATSYDESHYFHSEFEDVWQILPLEVLDDPQKAESEYLDFNVHDKYGRFTGVEYDIIDRMDDYQNVILGRLYLDSPSGYKFKTFDNKTYKFDKLEGLPQFKDGDTFVILLDENNQPTEIQSFKIDMFDFPKNEEIWNEDTY